MPRALRHQRARGPSGQRGTLMRTLVLNAGYEPLAVVTFRRALLLVLTGKASVLAEDGDPVVGPREVLGRPSVILLHRYIKVPYREAANVTRRGVLRRDGHNCGYCGRHASTVDHIQPRSSGGQDTWENLVACCPHLQQRQGQQDPAPTGLDAAHRPDPPARTPVVHHRTGAPGPHMDRLPAQRGRMNFDAVVVAGGRGSRLGGNPSRCWSTAERRCLSTRWRRLRMRPASRWSARRSSPPPSPASRPRPTPGS